MKLLLCFLVGITTAHAQAAERGRRDGTEYHLVLDIRNATSWNAGHVPCAHPLSFQKLDSWWPRNYTNDDLIEAVRTGGTTYPSEIQQIAATISSWAQHNPHGSAALLFPPEWAGMVADVLYADHRYDELRSQSRKWMPRLLTLLKKVCGFTFVATFPFDPKSKKEEHETLGKYCGIPIAPKETDGDPQTTTTTRQSTSTSTATTIGFWTLPTQDAVFVTATTATTTTTATATTQSSTPHAAPAHTTSAALTASDAAAATPLTCTGRSEADCMSAHLTTNYHMLCMWEEVTLQHITIHQCAPIPCNSGRHPATCAQVPAFMDSNTTYMCTWRPVAEGQVACRATLAPSTWWFDSHYDYGQQHDGAYGAKMATFFTPFMPALCRDFPIVVDTRTDQQRARAPAWNAGGPVCSQIENVYNHSLPSEKSGYFITPMAYMEQVTYSLQHTVRPIHDNPLVIFVYEEDSDDRDQQDDDDSVARQPPLDALTIIRETLLSGHYTNIAFVTNSELAFFCASGQSCSDGNRPRTLPPGSSAPPPIPPLLLYGGQYILDLRPKEAVLSNPIDCAMKAYTFLGDEARAATILKAKLEAPHENARFKIFVSDDPSSNDFQMNFFSAISEILVPEQGQQKYSLVILPGNASTNDLAAEINLECLATYPGGVATPTTTTTTTTTATTTTAATAAITWATPPATITQATTAPMSDTSNPDNGLPSLKPFSPNKLTIPTTSPTTTTAHLVVHTKVTTGSTRTTPRNGNGGWGAVDTTTTLTTDRPPTETASSATTLGATTYKPIKPIDQDQVHAGGISTQTVVLIVSCIIGVAFGLLIGQIGKRFRDRRHPQANAWLPTCCAALCDDDARGGRGRRRAQYARLPYRGGGGQPRYARLPPVDDAYEMDAELSDTCDETDDDALLETDNDNVAETVHQEDAVDAAVVHIGAEAPGAVGDAPGAGGDATTGAGAGDARPETESMESSLCENAV